MLLVASVSSKTARCYISTSNSSHPCGPDNVQSTSRPVSHRTRVKVQIHVTFSGLACCVYTCLQYLLHTIASAVPCNVAIHLHLLHHVRKLYLVLFVDLDSIDANGLPRNCHLSWHFLGSAVLFVYFNYTIDKRTVT